MSAGSAGYCGKTGQVPFVLYFGPFYCLFCCWVVFFFPPPFLAAAGCNLVAGRAARCTQLLRRARRLFWHAKAPAPLLRYSPDKTRSPRAQSRSSEFPRRARRAACVGEGVIKQMSRNSQVQRGNASRLRGSIAGRDGEGSIPLLPAAPHILASPWREGSSFDGTLPASGWAVAAPGYPCVPVAGCIGVYPRCQPQSLLWRKTRGFWLWIQGGSSWLAPSRAGHRRRLVLHRPSILLPSAADLVLQMLRACLSPLD